MKYHQRDLVEVNFLFPDGTRGSHNWGQTPFVRIINIFCFFMKSYLV